MEPAGLLRGAMRTEPWKINSGCESERVGGRGPRGRVGSVWGSPGGVALVMAASGPVGGLGQRQALPEVFQLRLELLPFYCQLLSLGHQLLERTGNINTHTHTHYYISVALTSLVLQISIQMNSDLAKYLFPRSTSHYCLAPPTPCVSPVPRMTTAWRSSPRLNLTPIL